MKNKKKKGIFPDEVDVHFVQIINTIKTLQNLGFVKEYILPEKKIFSEDKNGNYQYQICWKNNVSGVNEKNFLSVGAYKVIASKRSYQIVLFDNSIVRCAMCFSQEGILKTQNFAYIPCPIDCFLEEDITIDSIVDDIDQGLIMTDNLLMRTTVRFDYDSTNDNENHPASHVHLQSPGTRILTNGPICFNRFMKHVIEVFYPDSYFLKKSILRKEQYEVLENFEFIEIKKEKLPKKNYRCSSMYKFL